MRIACIQYKSYEDEKKTLKKFYWLEICWAYISL